MIKEIKMAGPSITQHEIDVVGKMMRDGWDSYQYVEEFEMRFAKFHSKKFCLMTPCCTHAIHLALLALDIGQFDEVIVPECTWTGSVAPVTYVGAKPVFVDISKDNWCIDLDKLDGLITSKTKAIISVDLYGKMPDYDILQKICDKHNLHLIEDAAEALGSSYKGKVAGSFGSFSVHSFHRTKTITTGEGGAILTDDENLFERCKFLRDHGRSSKIPYFIIEPTPKYMPSNLMGALACAQLDRIDELIKIKRRIRDTYNKYLKCDHIHMTSIDDTDNTVNGAWATTIVVHNQGFNRDNAIEYFNSRSLPLRPFFNRLSDMPAYERFKRSNQDNLSASYLSKRGVTFPSHYETSEEHINLISQTMIDYLKTI